jgi:membrane-bound lytic murein transglycosylase D
MTIPFIIARVVLGTALVGALLAPKAFGAPESSFPLPAGLEDAVEFWKQVFSRVSADEVIFFDPVDPAKIYSVVRAPDSVEGRAALEKERSRLFAEYGLREEDGRIRTQRGVKENFYAGLANSGRYIGRMKDIFREEGLPADLAYLPLVESSFNWRARSSVGAVGMWQFMAATARKFLRINGVVDERRDPLVSTRAAARLLKENYRLLGNWPLAITAYNHGTEGIFRGIDATRSDNLVDLIREYQSPSFGFASKNFYAEFLAAVELATNRNEHFPFLRPKRPFALQTVLLKRAAPLNAILKPAAIDHDDFYEWNPAFHTDIRLIPAGYQVNLPPDKVDDFQAAQRRLAVAPVKATAKSQIKKPARSTPKLTKRGARKKSSAKGATRQRRNSKGKEI